MKPPEDTFRQKLFASIIAVLTVLWLMAFVQWANTDGCGSFNQIVLLRITHGFPDVGDYCE